MNKAKVLWFNDYKGHGYCLEESTQQEVFIHYSAIEGPDGFKTLKNGQEIFIEICLRNGKMCANRILPAPNGKKRTKNPTPRKIQLTFDLN